LQKNKEQRQNRFDILFGKTMGDTDQALRKKKERGHNHMFFSPKKVDHGMDKEKYMKMIEGIYKAVEKRGVHLNDRQCGMQYAIDAGNEIANLASKQGVSVDFTNLFIAEVSFGFEEGYLKTLVGQDKAGWITTHEDAIKFLEINGFTGTQIDMAETKYYEDIIKGDAQYQRFFVSTEGPENAP